MYQIVYQGSSQIEVMDSISPQLASAFHSCLRSQVHEAYSDASISQLGEGSQVLRQIADSLQKKIEWDAIVLGQIDILRLAENPEALTYKILPSFADSLSTTRQLIHKLYNNSKTEIPALSEMLDHTFLSIKVFYAAAKEITLRVAEERGTLPAHGISRSDFKTLAPLIHQVKEDYLHYLNSCLPNPTEETQDRPVISDIQKRTQAA